MSISVKDISLSLNGTPSTKFKIEIDGAKYRIDALKLTQRLLEPMKLEFTLRKDPDEDISEIQFTACSTIIGKPVTLTLQTDSIEQQIAGFSGNDQNADIEFEGIVTSAHARRCQSEYVIEVEALTKDATLKDHPHCEVYNEDTLSNIVSTVLQRNGIENEVQPNLEDQIFYTAQYNETNYQFLQRLARRHGEWMFNTGKKLHFGKFSEQESIALAYPSQDLPEYSARLATFHPTFRYAAMTYNEMGRGVSYMGEDQQDTGNALNDAVFSASKENYPQPTNKIMAASSIETDDEAEQDQLQPPLFCQEPLTEQQRQRANMLVYEGRTFCSKLKIGARLTIKDNFTSSGVIADKSEVQQDEILITEVVHCFGVDDEYENHFRGITAAIDYPPYMDRNIFPRCNHPVRAHVVATEDPKHWGRVKVRFPWQVGKYQQHDKNGATPWIHVAQQFSSFDEHGMHLIPEIFTEVYVDFEEGNFERPFVSGTHHCPNLPVDPAWYPGNNRVKAIRTSTGHTIEIHDATGGQGDELNYGDGGFIKVYDSHTQIYEVLLSTDAKLIRLNCQGDIVMHADGNINMSAGGNVSIKAGGHVSNSAGGDFNAGAGGTFNGSAGSEVLINAGSNFSAKASAKMDLTSSDEMTIHAGDNMSVDTSKELSITSEKNMSIMTHKCYSLTVEEDSNESINKNLTITVMNNAELKATNKLDITAMDITEQAQNGFKEYSVSHEMNATATMKLQATATIDIKAPMIKEN